MSPQVCTVRRRRHSELILAVNLCKQDCHFLRTVFSSFPWKLASVATLAGGLRHVRSQSVPVIVCECDFRDGNWKLLLEEVGRLTKPPRLIVASRFADERLWAEVLNLGGHDVLATPFDADEVHRVVSYAVDSWHFQVDAKAKCG
jgi:DNA-binding NtrC family response regulator